MSIGDSDRLLHALKQVLKQRGLRYADLARVLGVSEPTVKRMFGRGRLDLQRLERICAVLDIDFFELARLARGARDTRPLLTQTQEAALAAQPRLLTVFHLLCNDWTVAQIREEFAIDEPGAIRLLARLDRLGLIELLPRNRVRLRVARDFAWREDGPVRSRHVQAAIGEFLQDGFDGRDAVLRVELREVGDASQSLLKRRVERLVAEFHELAELDASLPSSRRRSVGLVMAMRPWVFSLLDSLRAQQQAPAGGARRRVATRRA